MRYLIVFALFMLPVKGYNRQSEKLVRVLPREMDSLLTNPGIGFTTFQRFNGDTLNPAQTWTEGFPIQYQPFSGNLANTGYPQTSVAYFRVDWAFVEKAPGVYNWPMIDSALKTAAERGQTLMLRIAPYEGGEQDVPAWYRKMVGAEKKLLSHKWRVDPEDPRYLKYFGGLVKELARRYDGHPDLEAVDISIVGYWGEGDGMHLLTDATRVALLNCYLNHFKKTTLLYQPLNGDAPDAGELLRGTRIAASWPDGRNNFSEKDIRFVGYRLDCLGDLSHDMWVEQKWSHMADIYPRDIIRSGMYEAWKKTHVSMEICGTFFYWLEEQKFDLKTVEHIFDQALKWHISTFNAKSSPVPEAWMPLVERWLKKMGYRFVLRKLEYPAQVQRHTAIPVFSLWENVGVAPIYRDYQLAMRLRSERDTIIIPFETRLRNWLPGDILVEETIFLPAGLSTGIYQVDLAIAEPVSWQPRVQLAIEGRQADGWYGMGKLEVME